MQTDHTPIPTALSRAHSNLEAAEARYAQHMTERNRIAADVLRKMVERAEAGSSGRSLRLDHGIQAMHLRVKAVD